MQNTPMRITDAISDAYERHIAKYVEHPTLVLVGPLELSMLVSEIAPRHVFSPTSHLSILDMMVVPKCGAGIDFGVSCAVAQMALANQLAPEEGN